MQEVFEKIIEKLEERTSFLSDCTKYGNNNAKQQNKSYSTIMMYEVADLVDDLIEIVKQEAEQYVADTNVGNNGWIPCSERLPEESGEYLTWVEYDRDRFIAIDEIDCDGIIKEWNCSTDYKVIAWQPLPQPFQKGE